MREMKNRLLAIEAELQTLYRETGDESEVSGILPSCGNTTAICAGDVQETFFSRRPSFGIGYLSCEALSLTSILHQ